MPSNTRLTFISTTVSKSASVCRRFSSAKAAGMMAIRSEAIPSGSPAATAAALMLEIPGTTSTGISVNLSRRMR